MGRLPITNVSNWFLLFFKNWWLFATVDLSFGTGDTKFGPGKYKMPTLSLLYLLPLLKGHLNSGKRDTFSESRNPGLTFIQVTPSTQKVTDHKKA